MSLEPSVQLTAVGNTSINATAGTGTIDLNNIGDGTPAAGIDGTLTVGNTTTLEVEFDGTRYNISGNVNVKSKTGERIKFTGTNTTKLHYNWYWYDHFRHRNYKDIRHRSYNRN